MFNQPLVYVAIALGLYALPARYGIPTAIILTVGVILFH